MDPTRNQPREKDGKFGSKGGLAASETGGERGVGGGGAGGGEQPLSVSDAAVEVGDGITEHGKEGAAFHKLEAKVSRKAYGDSGVISDAMSDGIGTPFDRGGIIESLSEARPGDFDLGKVDINSEVRAVMKRLDADGAVPAGKLRSEVESTVRRGFESVVKQNAWMDRVTTSPRYSAMRNKDGVIDVELAPKGTKLARWAAMQ